jgi:DNA-binding transcriptional LysR family regulator
MINQLEGRFIQTFIAVLEERSFSRAADRLGYVQSTVTTHIQSLEKICGQKLFHRLPRKIVLTEAGVKFTKYAYQFNHLSECIQESMDALNKPHGVIRLIMQESFYLTRILPFMKQHIIEYPDVKLHIAADFYQEILEGVLNFSFDFGIVPKNPERNELLFYPLIEETMVFVSSPNIAQNVKERGINALDGESLISGGNSCIYHAKASEFLKHAKVNFEDTIELSSLEMIKQVVSCGKGFALIPEIAVQEEINNGILNVLTISPKISFTHGLIMHINREQSFISTLFKTNLLNFFE